MTRAGHAYTPERTVNYEGRLAYAAQQAMQGRVPLDGPLTVYVEARMPIAASWPKKRQDAARRGELRPVKKPDLDNICKMLDALNLIAWVDDSQIVEVTIKKFYSAQPALIIEVRPLEGLFS